MTYPTIPPNPGQSTMTLAAFLAATDLGSLQRPRTELGHRDNYRSGSGPFIATWADRQAFANLLMYPELIPADLRVTAFLRGLALHSDGYLRLAATIGVGSLDFGDLTAAERVALVEALLDLVAGDSGPAAIRAAAEFGRLMHPGNAPELVVLLTHPDAAVRHNVAAALARLLDPDSIADLLADRDTVVAADADAAAAALTRDGIDIHCPASDQRLLPALPYLPTIDDWRAACPELSWAST